MVSTEIINNLLVMQIPLNLTGANVTMPSLPPITLANLFGDLTTTLIVMTILIAVFLRTYSEYIAKLLKGEIAKFDPKYIGTAIIAFVSLTPLALSFLPEGIKVFAATVGEWGVAGALVIVGISAYGWNHGVNQLASLSGHFLTSARTTTLSSVKQEEGTPKKTGKDPV